MKTSIAMIVVVLGILLAMGSTVRGDIVHLRDGTVVEGEVRKEGQFWVVTKEDGSVQHIGQDRVQSVEITGRTDLSPERAETRLASLRRSVRNLRDLEQIIDRYERFVESAEGTPAEAEARRELAEWRERLAQDMVRIGDEWVTREQRMELQQEVLSMSGEARQLIRQSRLGEAEALLGRVMEIDPANATAWYLTGVLRYRQDQVPQARRAFERTRELLPEHGPTLNNLAVVMWRQNQHAGAINYYDQAMVAAPGERQILDNVAEALHALPPELAQRPTVQRVQRRFVEQDAQLRERMLEQGRHRWGATWVTEDQLEQLRGEEERIRAELDQLAREYDATQAHIRRIDRDIQSTQEAMQRIAATRWVRDREGRLIQLPMPATYFEMERDVRRLEAERAEVVTQLRGFETAARAVEQSRPVPQYTGVQRLYGEEAAPVIPPDAPAADTPADAAEDATAPTTPADPAPVVDENDVDA